MDWVALKINAHHKLHQDRYTSCFFFLNKVILCNAIIYTFPQLQVKELVSADVFSRYDSLLLESTIASMLNITYCPRSPCELLESSQDLF